MPTFDTIRHAGKMNFGGFDTPFIVHGLNQGLVIGNVNLLATNRIFRDFCYVIVSLVFPPVDNGHQNDVVPGFDFHFETFGPRFSGVILTVFITGFV